MRILYTTPFLPYPPEDGGRMISFHHVQGLAARGHELTTLFPLRRPEDERNLPRLREISTVFAFPGRRRPAWRDALAALLHGESVRVRRHRFAAARLFLETILHPLASLEFDIVFADSLFTAYLLPTLRRLRPRVPVVMLEHNVESQVFERLLAAQPRLAWRLGAVWETRRIRAAERAAAREVDCVLTLSAEDAQTLRSLAPSARAVVCGPGIPTRAGEPIPPPTERTSVLFLASYRWPPNADGATWMAKRVWPRVRAHIPEARLVLAGPDPLGKVRPLANPALGIETPGFVEDAAATTREATLAVAPLQVGGGVRIKILEALANERPVVSTSLGAEGLPLEHGRHLLIADGEESFAAAVARLLASEAERGKLARAGRALVEERFSWNVAIERLEKILHEVIARGRRGAAEEARPSGAPAGGGAPA